MAGAWHAARQDPGAAQKQPAPEPRSRFVPAAGDATRHRRRAGPPCSVRAPGRRAAAAGCAARPAWTSSAATSNSRPARPPVHELPRVVDGTAASSARAQPGALKGELGARCARAFQALASAARRTAAVRVARPSPRRRVRRTVPVRRPAAAAQPQPTVAGATGGASATAWTFGELPELLMEIAKGGQTPDRLSGPWSIRRRGDDRVFDEPRRPRCAIAPTCAGSSAGCAGLRFFERTFLTCSAWRGRLRRGRGPLEELRAKMVDVGLESGLPRSVAGGCPAAFQRRLGWAPRLTLITQGKPRWPAPSW